MSANTEQEQESYEGPDKNRVVRDHEAAMRNGFSESKTFYEIGRPVIDIGVQNAKKSLRQWEKMAHTPKVLEDGVDLIQSENRRYVETDATKLSMSQGLLWGIKDQKDLLPLTERGFERLCSLVTPGGVDYLKNCEIDLRDYNLNKWFPKAITPAREKAKELNLWIRRVPGQTKQDEIFSVFGSRYVPFGGDRILEIVKDYAPKGSRATFSYDGYKGRLDILMHSDIQPEKYVVGEYFKGGYVVKWADDGSGSIEIDALMYRNLCLNLIRIHKAKKKILRRKHLGDSESIKQDLIKGLKEADEAIAHFVNVWDVANKDNVMEKYGFDDPKKLFEGLVLNRLVWMPGVKVNEQVDRLLMAYEKEPGYSKAAFVNAVTRAAHEYSFENPWTAEELEQSAGELLYQKVWNIYTDDNNTVEY